MAPKEGKYFHIENSNGLVIDVLSRIEERAPLILKSKTPTIPTQLWFWDPLSRCMRNHFDDTYVMTNLGGALCITSFVNQGGKAASDQQFKLLGDRLAFQDTTDQVVTVEGQNLLVKTYNSAPEQKWKSEHVAPSFFRIKVAGESDNIVLDGEGGGENGCNVIFHKQNDGDNQIWYEDKDGVLMNKANDLALCSSKGYFKLARKDEHEFRKWFRHEDKIVNPISDQSAKIESKRIGKSSWLVACDHSEASKMMFFPVM
eukprot:GHVP01026259.1.p1 GENE.GHVP01026259.1~~GHVP01026259.1.p1  ORF type:complete len:258 (+),score=41.53 GHVP01026259.1:14-787(+)